MGGTNGIVVAVAIAARLLLLLLLARHRRAANDVDEGLHDYIMCCTQACERFVTM